MADIENINEPWKGHSGSEVEDFIKKDMQNKSKAIAVLEDKVPSTIEYENIDGDSEKIRLSLTNAKGETIASGDIPKGGGSADAEGSISISATASKSLAREGDTVTITFTYDHIGNNGSDGTPATIALVVKRGTSTREVIIGNVSAGTTRTIDVSEYLAVGTVEFYVRASCTTEQGTEQVRQAYVKVEVATLRLTSNFNIAASFANGGYSSTFEVPFTLVGTGTRSVTIFLDGVQYDSKTITNTQSTNNGSFNINAAELAAGRHNIQMVAEREGLISQSIFMDFLVAGSETPFIGTKIVFDDGRIYTATENPDMIPTLNVAQFVELSFDYAAYTGNISSEVEVTQNGSTVQTVTAQWAALAYTTTPITQGTQQMAFVSGETEYPFYIAVSAGAIDITEAESGLQLKLSPNGRSNSESNPADWGGITEFTDVDFRSSGWVGNTLKLANGAKAVIDYKPFAQDVGINGTTIEIEFRMTNVMDKSLNVISCLDSGKGILISPELAGCYTGSVKTIPTAEEDEHGQVIERTRPVGVEMRFAANLWLKAAFVIHSKDNGKRLMELYLNGVRSKADVYAETDTWMQTNAQPITIDSTGADVEIRNIRVYSRALTDDEVLNNYIVDRPSVSDMLTIYERNQVMDTNGKVDAAKLRSMGKGVFIFVRPDGLGPVNAKNDKKADFAVQKAYWFSPYGEEYDFVAEDFYMRIQGTSSTKYPRKNYRIYLQKGEGTPTLTVNGVTTTKKDNKYAMRPNSIPKELFCLKADFSDSSMTMNTGGAKLYDWVMRQLGLLTPPQVKDSRIRQAIDGIPCDVFCATSDNLSDLEYYGQYNFNNEKSKSGNLFGMEGVDGFTAACPIALEALNNSNPAANFQAPKNGLEEWLLQYFDDGFEFNYPEDTFYNPARIKDSEKESEASAVQKTAITTLMSWIASVTPDGADYNDLSTFVSASFKAGVADHFNVNYLLTYYLITDYWGSVDQRAKNILWRTWDGQKWYPTFYDGDTAMGMRNDSFLTYLYDMDRNTFDIEANKYVYEGHNSNLWCLVLANLETELRACAANLRARLTKDKMLEVFNGEQMGNWCERLYNKSGEFKYITPLLVGAPKEDVPLATWNYIYALTGNREAHRELFLAERGKLLDGRYATESFAGDSVDFYIGRDASDPASNIKVTSAGIYYYGVKTRNDSDFPAGQPYEVQDGQTTTIEITRALTTNDPLFLAGASHIKVLDLRGIANKIVGQIGLNLCSSLRELNVSTETVGASSTNVQLSLTNCLVLEKIDVTGQLNVSTDGGTSLVLSNQTRLKSLKAGNTRVTAVSIAEGAPIEELVLPASIETLMLKNLPHLTADGLTLQGLSNVTSVNIANCPGIDAMSILTQCTNVDRVRIEGLKGKISLDLLLQYMNGNLQGYDAQGNGTDNCRLCGDVTLDRVATKEEMTTLAAYYVELTIHQCPFSHYWFADEEIDPANITNEDNKTGWAYPENIYKYKPETTLEEDWLATHPNGYVASGHVNLLHDRCKPVLGRINQGTGKMVLTELSKSDYSKTVSGEDADISANTDNGQDVFIYIPRYWYKGVNEFKKARKHFFLCSQEVRPSTSVTTRKIPLSELDSFAEKATSWETFAPEGVLTDNSIMTLSSLVNSTNYTTYRVNVEGMKQARFPSVLSDYTCCVFADADNKVLVWHCLNMSDISIDGTVVNPKDFDEQACDYDFHDVPEGAKWLWFTCKSSFYANMTVEDFVVLTDSSELEAIEPDWVEHQPELVGAYQGFVLRDSNRIALSGLRSLYNRQIPIGTDNPVADNPGWSYDDDGILTNTSVPNGSRMMLSSVDYCNLALVRGNSYREVTYETVKDLANLFMVWFGTRGPENIVGIYMSTGGYTSGVKGPFFNDSKKVTGGSEHNKIWGIEDWLTSLGETYEHLGTCHLSFDDYIKAKRKVSGSLTNIIIIRRRDGSDCVYHYLRIEIGNSFTTKIIARVKFGRYCDIVKSSSTNASNTQLCYTDSHGEQQLYASGISNFSSVYRRTGSNNKGGGLIAMVGFKSDGQGSTLKAMGRLCYYGDFQNESDINDQLISEEE